MTERQRRSLFAAFKNEQKKLQEVAESEYQRTGKLSTEAVLQQARVVNRLSGALEGSVSFDELGIDELGIVEEADPFAPEEPR